MQGEARLNRLQWLSRRGMKELDVLLEGFLRHNRESLINGGFPELEDLLSWEDDRLWQAVLRPSSAADAPVAHRELLELIRDD